MKVLVADKFEQSGLDGLKGLGCEVLFEPDLKDEALRERLNASSADALVVRSTKVTRDMIQAPQLKLIIRAGAGYNTIDVDAATERRVLVANCPGKNSVAVAELVIGLMVACDRHIPDNVAQLRAGKWNKKEFSKARGLHGRTLGVVGMGSIGQEVTTRAQAFGMTVIVYSKHYTEEDARSHGVTCAESLEDLAARSDFVSVNVALTGETRGCIGKSFFDALRPGSVFINTSRAEVVVQAALEEATRTKGITAGLDVFEGEPSGGEGEYAGSLRDNPNVYCCHHIGASTDQAQEAVATEVVRIVDEFMRTGTAPNVVNPF